MVPYYGRHGTKQFIHGKPIRYGFKVWSLCTNDGSGIWFEPYCGRDTNVADEGFGQGPNVVLDLITKAGLKPGSELYFDNLFTSFPLLNKLSNFEMAGTGTVRQNHLNNIPIKKKAVLEKKQVPRGTSDVVYKDDIVLVAWKDNKPVYMASNKFGGEMSSTCRRYSRVEHKSIQVSQKKFLNQSVCFS